MSSHDSEFFEPRRPRIIAHRGASAHFPENTLPAFRAAREMGARYIELDIHLTRDGEVVVSHDGDLRRTCSQAGLIAQLSYSELRHADAGFNFNPSASAHFPFRGRGITIPRLSEVLNELSDCYFVIEIKPDAPNTVACLLEVIDGAAMRRRVLVASEHDTQLAGFRALAPEIPTGFAYREIVGFMLSLAPDAPAYQPKGDALQIPSEYESWRMVTPESVAAAHRLGVEVHVWTVNDEREMCELIKLGVDGIITNWPQRMGAIARDMPQLAQPDND
ncbi:MAG: glycerophosphodiester phosphodiesterase [Candidatus Binataceae bacterium]